MAGYVTFAEFRARTVMPGPDVDALENAAPGWLEQQSETISRYIDGRLRKRCGGTPFAEPSPEIVKNWAQRILTHRAYIRRGIPSTDAHFITIQEDAKLALDELQEAANSEESLWDLPLADNSSAITREDAMVYSETNPFDWMDLQ